MLNRFCCVQLCNSMDCSLPGSTVHWILQARILEQVAISYSRGSSQPRDRTCVSCISCIGRQVLYHWCRLGTRLETCLICGTEEKCHMVWTHVVGSAGNCRGSVTKPPGSSPRPAPLAGCVTGASWSPCLYVKHFHPGVVASAGAWDSLWKAY